MEVVCALSVSSQAVPAPQIVQLDADIGYREEKEVLRMSYRSTRPSVELQIAKIAPGQDSRWKEPHGLRSVFENPRQDGQPDKAMGILLHSDQQGIVPSVQTYCNLLRICVDEKDLAGAQRVRAHVAKNGLDSNLFLGESLVNTLVKCGSLEDALQVFHRLPEVRAFSCTAVMIGYIQEGRAEEAFTLFEQMQTAGVQPNNYTLVALLRACGSLADLKEGKRIHSEVRRHGCESDVFVCNTLVDMYARCGSMMDAQHVFDEMPLTNVVSWSSIIAGYTQQEQGDKALDLFAQMQEQGVEPDERIFTSAIKACSQLAALETSILMNGVSIKGEAAMRGKAMHAEAVRRGYDTDIFFGSTLVHFYAGCGCTADAHQVFDKLPQRDVVAWTALIARYAEQEQYQQALQLFNQMQGEGIRPNSRTFVTVLKACSSLAEGENHTAVDGWLIKMESLQKGKALNAQAVRLGCSADIFLGTTLVSMYAKCGSIVDAQHVFSMVPERNVVSWNAMIAGYAQQEQGQKAWDLYVQMLAEGIDPDMWTFVGVLKALGTIAPTALLSEQPVQSMWLQKGKAIHSEIVARGFESDVFVGNTLVHMYASFGSMVDARIVFDNLPHNNVVSWNAMIAGYAQQEQGHKALQLYRQMQEAEITSDSRTFVSVLNACASPAALERETILGGIPLKAESLQLGKVLHAEVARRGYISDVYVGNTIVHMYANCGSMVDAQEVFGSLLQDDIVSWNAMLAGYAQQEQGDEAWQLYVKLQQKGVKPDAGTFVSLLKACGSLGTMEDDMFVDGQSINLQALEKGKAVHADLTLMGYESDMFVGNALASMYVNCRSMLDVQHVFGNLSERNVVSWNSLIIGYMHTQQVEKALHAYAQMSAEGICPNDTTFLGVLKACSKIGALSICKDIHLDITESGSKLSVALATALIHAYGKCGSMVDARRLFDSLPHQDVVSWSALIAGYAWQGDCETCLQCFDEMQEAGVDPNGITFLSLLSVCSHAGLVDRGMFYFQSLSQVHGISATMEHYAIMVDLLARAGLLGQAEDLILEMPMQPDFGVWASLLAACRKFGDVLLGRRTFDRLIRLDPKEGASYILMCNIYADAGMWEFANEIEKLKRDTGAWKRPGRSWIEHEHELLTFVVADQTNEHVEQTYALLDELTEQLKGGGLPDVRSAEKDQYVLSRVSPNQRQSSGQRFRA